MRAISILLLLFPTFAFSQNAITGSVQYDYKPVQTWNGHAYIVEQQGKLIARITAAYKIKDIEISTQSMVNLSDMKDISALVNVSIPLP